MQLAFLSEVSHITRTNNSDVYPGQPLSHCEAQQQFGAASSFAHVAEMFRSVLIICLTQCCYEKHGFNNVKAIARRLKLNYSIFHHHLQTDISQTWMKPKHNGLHLTKH